MALIRRLGPLLAAFLLTLPLAAHPPLPASVLHPLSAPEAWNILRLAVANVERLLAEHRLTEVPDQVSLCSPALRFLTPPQGSAAVVQAALAVQGIAQASLAGDEGLARNTLAQLQTRLHDLEAGYTPEVVHAEIYFCPMHPDLLSAEADARCERCGMALVPRRIPWSFVYTPPGAASLHLSATTPEPLHAGRPAKVTLRLTQADGTPVFPEELLVVHTQPIHLLIVDSTLGDYHHEHPVATGVPGEYAFGFTPQAAGPYRIFADLVPAATDVQEYPFTDLPGEGPAAAVPLRDARLESQAGGLRFHLSIDDLETTPLQAREPRTLRVRITDGHGGAVRTLAPVMNAFAHMVGFYEDRRTVLHLHPAGGEVTDPNARGGPELEFRFFAPKAGALRLYCQVQVGGQMLFAPFDLQIP